jgi:hypothetical protein
MERDWDEETGVCTGKADDLSYMRMFTAAAAGIA